VHLGVVVVSNNVLSERRWWMIDEQGGDGRYLYCGSSMRSYR
jgi:hypothetical protein